MMRLGLLFDRCWEEVLSSWHASVLTHERLASHFLPHFSCVSTSSVTSAAIFIFFFIMSGITTCFVHTGLSPVGVGEKKKKEEKNRHKWSFCKIRTETQLKFYISCSSRADKTWQMAQFLVHHLGHFHLSLETKKSDTYMRKQQRVVISSNRFLCIT